MVQTSALYKSILADENHGEEWRVTIGGTVYGEDKIAIGGGGGKPKLTRNLFSGTGPELGACVSATFTCTVREESANIPRMAAVVPEFRLALGEAASEWITLGTFYIDVRKPDKASGNVSLSCLDAMMKADGLAGKKYLDLTSLATWPQPMTAVVADIAAIIGVSVDARTVLNTGTGYTVGYPVGYTMREVLGFIAAAHGGCWTITHANALRLVPLTGTSDSLDIGWAVRSLENPDAFSPWSGVSVFYGDNESFNAGDETGRVLTCDDPWAEQETADGILSVIKDAAYQPFRATGATMALAAELGDGLTVGGSSGPLTGSVTGHIFTMEIACGGLSTCTVGAPGDEEVDHEYPYTGAAERAFSREKAYVRATFSIMTDAIEGKVSSAQLNTLIGQYVDSSAGTAKIVSACSATYQTISGMSDYALKTYVSAQISQSVSPIQSAISLTASYSDDSIGSNVRALLLLVSNPSSSSITIKADKIDFTGFTTFLTASDVGSSGSTSIDGGRIATGTISADRIDVSTLKVKRIYNSNDDTVLYSDGQTHLYIGGVPGSWNIRNTHIYAQSTIHLTTNDSSSNSDLTVDLSGNTFYSTDSRWTLGTSSYPFGAFYGSDFVLKYTNINGSFSLASTLLARVSSTSSYYHTLTLTASSNTKAALLPYSNYTSGGSIDIGSSNACWGDTYVTTLTVDGINPVTTMAAKYSSTTYSLTMSASSSGAVVTPSADEKITIGSSSYELAAIYTAAITVDGVNPVTTMRADWSSATHFSLTMSAVSGSSAAVTPSTAGAISLGSSSYPLAAVYCGSGSTRQVNIASALISEYSSSYYQTVTLVAGTSAAVLTPYTNYYNGSVHLGSSSAKWGDLYTVSAHLCDSSSAAALGFFGHTANTRQTLSTASQNMGYTSATASNYLIILNNLVGILKEKYGLIN